MVKRYLKKKQSQKDLLHIIVSNTEQIKTDLKNTKNVLSASIEIMADNSCRMSNTVHDLVKILK
ncbi:hypothetical protein [Listeria booriae]|uniref:hypothetical protein n=1 Tax=Listeria booriae TaxID=1552123 RepID=UPI00162A5F71|nr:hypothetical protein [Listeria booriae]MBC1233677.1 hypothetical protein [Listeria booriae]